VGDRLTRGKRGRARQVPGEGNKGSVVVKSAPKAKILMTLGKPGVRGNPPAL